MPKDSMVNKIAKKDSLRERFTNRKDLVSSKKIKLYQNYKINEDVLLRTNEDLKVKKEQTEQPWFEETVFRVDYYKILQAQNINRTSYSEFLRRFLE